MTFSAQLKVDTVTGG